MTQYLFKLPPRAGRVPSMTKNTIFYLQTASWMCDYLAVNPSAIGQPTWPTQPSIPQGSVNE